MTILRFWQQCDAEPSVSTSLEKFIRESIVKLEHEHEHEERKLVGIFELDLSAVREHVLDGFLSRYNQTKLLAWLDSQTDDVVEITTIQKYLRRFIADIAMRIAISRELDCQCSICGTTVKFSEMGREPWSYYVNPLFAGTGYYLTCPRGHALLSIQETIS